MELVLLVLEKYEYYLKCEKYFEAIEARINNNKKNPYY